MLLIHQTGSVRVGEVVRSVAIDIPSMYTVTYTPTADPVRPIPAELYVKVKNTSAIPLRAAYLHGPYTLYTSCYPSTFDPNIKLDQQETEGIPQFEPYLKAGGNWGAVITVPRRLRQYPGAASVEPESQQKLTWIIEILSQVVFSSSASVNFELLVGRDQKSVELVSSGGVSFAGLPQAAQLRDHWSAKSKGKQVLATNGVYSRSITLLIDDTESLWNTPAFPLSDKRCEAEKDDRSSEDYSTTNAEASTGINKPTDGLQSNRCKKKIHLVILTHGLHSNLGADMLYLKESIDAAARKAKEQADGTRQQFTNEEKQNDHDEQIVVRGFPGNAVRTERGIQYLGKRLAKYVLLMAYPGQPCIPCHNAKAKALPRSLALWKCVVGESFQEDMTPDYLADHTAEDHAYQVTGISFVGHSLGGLVQTYAIAYIQKHCPKFFDRVRPVNFIALATPFLGLSNENPMYVRFALDLGLVGRTGQDLGLSWTAPRVRSGWEAIVGGKGNSSKPQESNAGSKPLLRILPCGPAHEALRKFQHRTVYSNVVNDGIVPLRTSCLLFLDWRGLERVEKARRENGIVGTMAEWGWAELTGANSKSPRTRSATDFEWKDTGQESNKTHKDVPKMEMSLHRAMTPASTSVSAIGHQLSNHSQRLDSPCTTVNAVPVDDQSLAYNPLGNLFSMFRPKGAVNPLSGHKQTKMLKRSQTLSTPSGVIDGIQSLHSSTQEFLAESQVSDEYGFCAPPKTTLFESASDLLMPPIPPIEYIIDPTSRPRTIFHDRVYRPEDIPPPLTSQRRTLTFSSSQNKASKAGQSLPEESPHASHHSLNGSESGLKIEEKIARAYHRDLTWRKVLVRLEPDAHNNIIVRRMFTNAYGWPVVKHLVDTHFGYTSTAQSKDHASKGVERARPPTFPTSSLGDEVQGQDEPPLKDLSSREFGESPPLKADAADQDEFISFDSKEAV
ncbi:hypothetical protein BBP40_012136 [Aspergillus hancockii]|nr:hypothetical protein BBP40_012136 [Aspergillus hancockii]